MGKKAAHLKDPWMPLKIADEYLLTRKFVMKANGQALSVCTPSDPRFTKACSMGASFAVSIVMNCKGDICKSRTKSRLRRNRHRGALLGVDHGAELSNDTDVDLAVTAHV